ncbi:MAG: DUF507 family protein [Deltaproteobacteria bacterium]|nr:DUF507 family protein [Deltaproteobacteria bacterium]
MRLYRARIPQIAHAVIDRLTAENDIEVAPENRTEAEQDIVAIMETFLHRDLDLRDAVRDKMSRDGTPYDQYSKVRSTLADAWGHPTGETVPKFLARQIVENFMISRFVEEVFTEDDPLFRKVLDTIRSFDVDERALREEAQAQVKNLVEGTVDYEVAFAQALKEVRRRHGLL